MTSTPGLLRGLIAACLIGCAAYPVLGLMTAATTGPHHSEINAMTGKPVRPDFDFANKQASWVDDFHRLTRDRDSDELDRNVVIVAKAVPSKDAAPDAAIPEMVEPKDAPKATPTDDVDQLRTGSINPKQPLLPPVPGPDAFKVQKGDRLGSAQRMDAERGASLPTSPSPDGAVPDAVAPDAGKPGPHADMAPGHAAPMMLPAVKSAMLLPHRADKLKPSGPTLAVMKPMDLAPNAAPDPLFQGPPIPADPTLDPDAPVLGYAAQMASAEAPFKALFAVTPAARQSWLNVAPAPPKAKATKPSKLAHAVHHRSRKHET